MRKLRSLSILATALAVLAYTSSASAVINTYNFRTVLSGTGPNVSFATLTIDDVTNVFSFSPVDLNTFGSGAYVGSLAVNYTTGLGSLDATRLSGGVGAGNVDIANGGGPGGNFDFRYDLFQGQDRLTNGETLSWSSVDFDLSQLSGLALHVQGVTGGTNSSSIWYSPTPAVPEPETYVMMLAGLALVSVVSRRKK